MREKAVHETRERGGREGGESGTSRSGGDRPLRIGIDFHLAEREGTGNCTYIRNLTEALLSLDRRNEYFLYITRPQLPYYKRFSLTPNVRLRPLGSGSAPLRLLLLGLKTYADRLDVLHVQYVAPPFFRGHLVVTVHDIAFIRLPGMFAAGQRLYLKYLVPRSLRRASQVLTISEFSRREILSHYRLPSRRVSCTPLAAEDRFKPADGRARASVDRKLKALGAERPFLLFVGRIDPRKDISGLIEAFGLLKKARALPHRLVIAGKKAYLSPELRAGIARGEADGQVLFTGFFPEELLPGLYSRAEVFVYPSLYEGFGLPLVEAMACGCPVVSVKASAVPEVVERAGLLVGPGAPRELADAIWRVVAGRKRRADMVRRGLKQAAKFRWEETAARTLAAYGRAARPGAGPRMNSEIRRSDCRVIASP